MTLSFVNYEIISLVEDITMSIVPYVESKNINVIFDTYIEELEIKCDPESIERVILNILSNDTLHPVENVPHLHLSREFHRTFCFVLTSAISTVQAFPVLEYNAFCPVRFFRICPACSLPVAVPDRPDCIWTQPMFCMHKHQTDLIPLLLLS